jgi:spore maturation protein CgeB
MRILQLWTLYDGYLDAFYKERPGLASATYAQQREAVLDDGFGWPPAVGRRLAERGHDVEIVIGNCEPMQRAWAREANAAFAERDWLTSVPAEQLRRFRPDVLWIGSEFQYFGRFLRSVRQHCGSVVAWTAAPLPVALDLGSIDCMVTSHVGFQETFRRRGVRCERMLPCFEPRMLESVGDLGRDVPVSFVGGLTWAHIDRVHALCRVAEVEDLEIWSTSPPLLTRSALRPAFWRAWLAARPLRAGRHPAVFGEDMYRVLGRSVMTINVHAGVAGGLAGNMRMFEATGMGALLLTEDMPNLSGLFEPGVEVVAYRDPDDLCAKIRYYSERPAEARATAASGQRRTLRDYNTSVRAGEIEALFADLRGAASRTTRRSVESATA